MKVIVSRNGAIQIPAELLRKYNLVEGSEVVLVNYGGRLSIIPAVKDPIKQGYGMLKGVPSLLDALKQDREEEKERNKRFLNLKDGSQ